MNQQPTPLTNRERFLAGEKFGFRTVRKPLFQYQKRHDVPVVLFMDELHCRVQSVDDTTFIAVTSILGYAHGSIIHFDKLIFN